MQALPLAAEAACLGHSVWADMQPIEQHTSVPNLLASAVRRLAVGICKAAFNAATASCGDLVAPGGLEACVMALWTLHTAACRLIHFAEAGGAYWLPCLGQSEMLGGALELFLTPVNLANELLRDARLAIRCSQATPPPDRAQLGRCSMPYAWLLCCRKHGSNWLRALLSVCVVVRDPV